jgi:hypothetical protein
MLIDQMKEHPEAFRGYGGKFANLLDAARDAIQGTLRNTWMSQRDATAILAAAETHLYEVWLAEDVLTAIMNPKGTQYAISAPNWSITRPAIALAKAPPKGIPATTHVKVSVICSGGTAPSATP